MVFLRADTDILMRASPCATGLTSATWKRDYIDSLRKAYDAFFADYHDTRLLTIDANALDFVASDEDGPSAGPDHGRAGRAPRQESLPGFNGVQQRSAEPAEAAPAGTVPPAPPPDLDGGERRLRDYQQFHDWLDSAKGFDRDPLLNFVLLQEEVGEVARLLSRRYGAKRDQGQTPPSDAIGAELADVLAYLLKLAN